LNVGQDSSDLDAVAGEERFGPGPESGRGLVTLVGANLGVGQPGVVIDSVVDDRISESVRPLLDLVPRCSAEDLVTAAVTDPPKFFLTSSRYRPADRRTVDTEVWNRSAARRSDQPSSTAQRAKASRPRGLNNALP
jgi:hypothetical protein